MMTNDVKDIRYFVEKLIQNEATEADIIQLQELLNKGEQDEQIKAALQSVGETFLNTEPSFFKNHEEEPTLVEQWKQKLLYTIEERGLHGNATEPSHVVALKSKLVKLTNYRKNLKWIAAAVVLIVSIAAYKFYIKQPPIDEEFLKGATLLADDPVIPLGATLTIENGKEIHLDSIDNALLTTITNAHLTLRNGRLEYQGETNSKQLIYHTIRTPHGRQFKLLLPDGTEVWLNTASTITYPTHFDSSNRLVKVYGEAYFEVKPAKKPFVVETERNTIHVLGTKFNINSYGSYNNPEKTTTTLLEGSVQVITKKTGDRAKAQNSYLLKVGQQLIQEQADSSFVQQANLDQVIAWKSGFFNFDKSDLLTVVNEIARWYDLDVTIEGELQKRRFNGGLQRSLPLEKVLTILKNNDINFELNGRSLKLY